MPCNPTLAAFIRTHFPSVWTLEVLLFLRENAATAWRKEQLVAVMRASETVVSNAFKCLHDGGLIVLEEDGTARYATASADLDTMVAETHALYVLKPHAVRSLIISRPGTASAAFSESFKFRREP